MIDFTWVAIGLAVVIAGVLAYRRRKRYETSEDVDDAAHQRQRHRRGRRHRS